jgi:hypothetical protein
MGIGDKGTIKVDTVLDSTQSVSRVRAGFFQIGSQALGGVMLDDMTAVLNGASVPPTAVNGVCGSANGTVLASTPTTNLCSVGAASSVTGSGPWSWSCAGSNGGTTASCSAYTQSSPPPTVSGNGLKIDLSYVDQSSSEFVRFKTLVDDAIAGNPDYGFTGEKAALMYMITRDAKYLDFAIQWIETCPNSFERRAYGTPCGLQTEEATINAGGLPYVAGDSYLEVGDIIGSLAMVYDLAVANNKLTSAQKIRWEKYADQANYNVWNPASASWGGKSYPWTGWSINNPGNNYYYSFVQASMYWALAKHDSTLLTFVRNQKLQPLIDYYKQIPGGGSLEGIRCFTYATLPSLSGMERFHG